MRIKGTRRANTLVGTDREDFIYGLDGNDVIYGNGGPDTIYAGEGADLVYLTVSGVRAWGEGGDDRFVAVTNPGLNFKGAIDGGDGADTVDLRGIKLIESGYPYSPQWVASGTSLTSGAFDLTSIETFWASENAATFYLGSASPTLTVHGSSFGDTFYPSAAGGSVYAEGGDDTFTFNEYLTGTGTTTLDGGAGSDTISLSSGVDIDLAIGSFVLRGVTYVLRGIENVSYDFYGPSIGSLYGDAADNRLMLSSYSYYNSPTRTLEGRGGNDYLRGSDGTDIINGGDGDDFIRGMGGLDSLDGGRGSDTVSFADVGSTLYVALSTKGPATVVFGNGSRLAPTGFESVEGSSSARNELIGSKGANRLVGGRLADIINGDAGDDVIVGDGSADRLTGGSGADRFEYVIDSYVSPAYAGTDVITDFSTGEGDKIAISLAPSPFGSPLPDLVFIGNAAFSGTAGEVRFETVDGTTIVMVDVNGYSNPTLTIALTGDVALAALDFVL